jgi:hypothetical protein
VETLFVIVKVVVDLNVDVLGALLPYTIEDIIEGTVIPRLHLRRDTEGMNILTDSTCIMLSPDF